MIVRLGRYFTFRTQCRGAGVIVLSVSNIQSIYHNVFLRAPRKRPQGVSGRKPVKQATTPPENPPETRLIYFTHMHGYAHHRIAGDFGREKGSGR